METSVPGGYAGQILRVDLTNERIWTQSLSPEEYRQYLGVSASGPKSCTRKYRLTFPGITRTIA